MIRNSSVARSSWMYPNQNSWVVCPWWETIDLSEGIEIFFIFNFHAETTRIPNSAASWEESALNFENIKKWKNNFNIIPIETTMIAMFDDIPMRIPALCTLHRLFKYSRGVARHINIDTCEYFLRINKSCGTWRYRYLSVKKIDCVISRGVRD